MFSSKRIRFWLQMIWRVMLLAFFMIGLNAWIAWNLLKWLDTQGVNSDFSSIIWLTFFVSFTYLYGRIIRRPKWIQLPLIWVGSYIFVIYEWIIVATIGFQLIYWPINMAGMIEDSTNLIEIYGWSSILLIVIGLIWGSYQAWSPVVRTYQVKLHKKALDGREHLKIVMFSDLHVGRMVGKTHIRRLLKMTRELHPELILIAGDVLDDAVEPFLEKGIDYMLGELRAKHGIYAILGNHEYIGGGIPRYVQAMQAQGIRVLRDEVIQLDGIGHLIGRKDRAAEMMFRGDQQGRRSLQELISEIESQAFLEAPVILMDHQPYGLEYAASNGVDIELCGHTHRGQIFPNQWITARIFELDWGYRVFGNMHAIVSSGFGTWGPPVRIGSRSEIIEILVQFETN